MYCACILFVYNIVTVEGMTLEGLISLLNFEGKTKVCLSSNSDKILVLKMVWCIVLNLEAIV